MVVVKRLAYGQPRQRSRQQGMTFIELLIAAAVFVVVLGLASVFFAQQVQLQRAVQSRNEVQDRTRVAMQLVTQDLSLAGNVWRLNAQGLPEVPITAFGGCFAEGCLTLDSGSPDSALAMRYMSSQFEADEACREVHYRVTDSVLLRADVTCGDGVADPDDFVALASDMLGFVVVFVCSEGTRIDEFPSLDCPEVTSYPRSALVSVAASSTVRSSASAATLDLVSTDPSSPRLEVCPNGRVCHVMNQEVLLPNLKDFRDLED